MKRRLAACLLFASATLWACDLPEVRAPSTSGVTQPAPTRSIPSATNLAPTEGPCYYVSASRDLPAASKSLESGLRDLNPQITGSAYAHGEDCVFADATRTFTAMETDFRVRAQVMDLKDEAKIGDLIALAMNVIIRVPAEEIQGPQPGRVEFEFYKSDSEELNLIVGIERYSHVAPGTAGAELFRMLRAGP